MPITFTNCICGGHFDYQNKTRKQFCIFMPIGYGYPVKGEASYCETLKI